MNEKDTACTIIHTNMLPRLRFLQESFAAMAETERADDSNDGTSLYDGAAIALGDIIATASEVIDILES